MQIRCLSINAQGLTHPWKRLYLYQTCTNLKIDILAVQETHMPIRMNSAWRNWRGEYVVVEGRAEKAAQGAAILIKLSLQPTNLKTIVSDNRLIILKLKLQGMDFVVINIYNAIAHRANEHYFTKIAQVLASIQTKDNIIIVGDFNRQRSGINKWLNHFESAFRVEDLAVACSAQSTPTHITTKARTVIDYCWVSSNLLSNAELAYLPNPLSEHLALHFIFEINTNRQRKCEKFFYFPHPAMPDTVDFVNQIYCATAALIQTDNTSNEQWEQCKRDISKLIQQENKTFNLKNKLQREFLENMLDQKNNYASISPENILKLRKQYMEVQKIDDLKTRFIIGKKIKLAANDIIPFLRTPLFNMLKKNNLITSLKVGDTVLIQQEMATAISKSLRQQFSSAVPVPSPVLPVDLLFHINDPETHALLDKYFNYQTVDRAITSLNKFAPAGPSAMTAGFIQRYKHVFIRVFVNIFKTWMLAKHPNQPRFTSFTICFDKRGTSPATRPEASQLEIAELGDLRPINLECTESKVYAKILYMILIDLVQDKIHPAQFCLAGRSIHNALNLLHEAHLNFKKCRRDPPICLFVDICKAFDNVDQNYLLNKILEATNNVILTNGIKNYLVGKFTAYKWKNMVFEEFQCRRGVSQGSPLSSLLFAIYLDETLRLIDGAIPGIFLPSLGHNVRAIAYADDLVVFCADEEEIEIVFDLIVDIGEKSGMKINRMKTSALYLNNFTPIAKSGYGRLKKFLGLPMPLFSRESRMEIQEKIMDKYRTVCQAISVTKTSLKAKVKMVNILCIPKLNFYVPHMDFPRMFIKKLDAITTKILWGPRKPVIAKRIMRHHYKNGGLSLIDTALFIRVLKANAFITWTKFLDMHSDPEVMPTDTPPPWFRKSLFAKGLTQWQEFQDDFQQVSPEMKVRYRDIRETVYTKDTASAMSVALASVPRVVEKLLLPMNVYDFAYKVIHCKLPTGHLLVNTFKVKIDTTCPMCTTQQETANHLLLKCSDYGEVRRWMATDLGLDVTPFNTIFECMSAFIDRHVQLRILTATLFLLWKIRCMAVFSNTTVRKIIYIKHELKEIFKKDRQICARGDISQYWPFTHPVPTPWNFLL